MTRLLIPSTLLITLTGCIFYKDARDDEDRDDDDCWEGDRYVCDTYGTDDDLCWDGRRWVDCEDDGPQRPDDSGGDDGDDVATPEEFGIVLAPAAAPQNLTFIASLFTTGETSADEIAWVEFTARDNKSILPAIIAQQPRSETERMLSISVPPDADLGVIDAYITFTDDDYMVIERIFEVLPEGEALPPWQVPDLAGESPADPVDTDAP